MGGRGAIGSRKARLRRAAGRSRRAAFWGTGAQRFGQPAAVRDKGLGPLSQFILLELAQRRSVRPFRLVDASTVVLLRALEDRDVLESVNGRIAVGWLVVEDLAMVFTLVLLPSLAGWLDRGERGPFMQAANENVLLVLAFTLAKVSAFVGIMLLVGRRAFPWLLAQVARIGSHELFTLCVIAVAVGIAYGSAELFGVSFALGAFFAGVVMHESDLSHRAAEELLPLRDAFAVLFFVSVGMLFDPAILIGQPLRILTVVAIIVVGKTLAAFLLVLALRYPLNTALTISTSLAQIGEFSFILAGLGVSLGLLPIEGQNLIRPPRRRRRPRATRACTGGDNELNVVSIG